MDNFDAKWAVNTGSPSRVNGVKPFIAMEILERAQQMEAEGRSIVHFELGEPAGETPELIKTAALKALQDNDTAYTHSLGKMELRTAIASYYLKTYGVRISPDQIIVTSGSSPAMLLAFSALLGQGEKLIMADPYYACYPNFVNYIGANPLFVPVSEEEGFKLKASMVKEHLKPGVKGVLINSPANPTGAVLDASELKELAELGTYIISDEVYHGINYHGEDHTILEYTDRAIVINGFSKRHIMTGWRLGYLIAPAEMIRDMQKLQQNLFICACSFIQSAGIAALTEKSSILKERFSSYNERRLFLYKSLGEMGLAPLQMPEGAFYMMANIKKYSNDSHALALKILEETGVALTPGIDFGPNAEGYLRISYACSMANLQEGLSRLAKYFASLEIKDYL